MAKDPKGHSAAGSSSSGLQSELRPCWNTRSQYLTGNKQMERQLKRTAGRKPGAAQEVDPIGQALF